MLEALIRVHPELGRVRLGVTGVSESCIRADPTLVAVAEIARRAGIALDVEFTLRPENCQLADDVMSWCGQERSVNPIFRASEDFLTTDAGERAGVTPAQRFHAVMFFDRLARLRAFDWGMRSYYRRVAERIESGAVSLTPDLGPVGPTAGDFVRLGARVVAAKVRNVRPKAHSALPRIRQLPAAKSALRDWRHVVITGWYGTETHGDKAILAELLDLLGTHAPECRVTVSSIHPAISRQTKRELSGLRGATCLDLARCADPALIESADAVIIGGGPLMESGSMFDLWKIFAEANRQRKARIVFGCGVGPIHSQRIQDLTASILELTTAGFLRDKESEEHATRLCSRQVLKHACDPAVGFIRRWRETHGFTVIRGEDEVRIAGLLRANTREFEAQQVLSSLEELNDRMARKVADFVSPTCAATGAILELLHMNAHWVGGDDRLINRQVEAHIENRSLVRTVRQYLTLDEHVARLSGAKLSIAMRYHGHIFSMALGIPFLSVDYTGAAGKVSSLMRRIGYEGFSVPWGRVDVADASALLQRLVAEREHWSAYLLGQTDLLVAQLRATYKDVFSLEVAA